MYAEIIIDIPFIKKSYFYHIPAEYTDIIKPFCRVKLSFREEKVLGLVIQLHHKIPIFERISKGDILKVIDTQPVFSKEQYSLAKVIRDYYEATISNVIFTMIPKGILTNYKNYGRIHHKSYKKYTQYNLLPQQQVIYNKIITNRYNNRGLDIHLVHGVTGSGKTLIYIKLIQKYLSLGYGVIFCIPEIILSHQILENFIPVFQDNIANIHSSISKSERWKQYKKILEKKVSLVVGTRSAIFAPVQNLRLIILDEEHDSSYKEQSKSFRYHAKEIATLRLKQIHSQDKNSGSHTAPLPLSLVLGSATPSLEAYYLAKKNHIHLHTMNKRATNMELPKVHIVKEKIGPENMISKFLKNKMEYHLKNNHQILLLLNRRGYANYIYCRNCKNVQKCIQCSVALVYHTKENQMGMKIQKTSIVKCHFCGYQNHFNANDHCLSCNKKTLEIVGYGTQRIENILEKEFPSIPYARLDRDTTNSKEYASEILKELAEEKIKILIGTQMIAKGLDIENITLVGILNTDIGLFIPEFRATERVFHLLSQTSGRAGRHIPGEVVFQTNNPDNFVIQTASNNAYIQFATKELVIRKQANLPPYKKLMRLLLESKDISKLEETVKVLQKGMNTVKHSQDMFASTHLKNEDLNKFYNVDIYGPIEAPIYKIKKRYRIHYIIKSDTYKQLQKFRNSIYNYLEESRFSFANIYIIFDMNPYDLL